MNRRPAHPRTPRRGPKASRAARHPFVHDPTVPPDQHDRRYCARCGCAGQPGDQRHHTDDETTAQRSFEQRRLGETD